jgi:hypothetical protein
VLNFPHNYSAAAQRLANSTTVTDPKAINAEALLAQVERQNLVLQTLIMILLEKKVVHEDELNEWLAYVDELDGARDGRLRDVRTPLVCPKCKRTNARTAVRCQWCNEDLPVDFLVKRPEGG